MSLLGTLYEDTVVSVEGFKINADNESVNGAGVDMLGYSGVMFVAVCGKGEVAACTIKAQQDSDSGFGTAADLLGSSKAFSAGVSTNGSAVLDIYKPEERYVRAVVAIPDLTTPAAVTIIAIKYGPTNKPTTQMTGELHVSPDEGTA
jgi:hypothetical protein